MAFNFAASGAGWRLAGSLIELANEISAAHPHLTCLGTLGDAAHVNEGTSSDHNPFIKDPHTGLGIVRAIDIGGPDAELVALEQHIFALYAAKFVPLWEYGYGLGTSKNLINNWGLPLRTHVQTGDAGHLHISVTQANGNSPSASGYVAAIDDRRSWGVAAISAPPAPAPPAPSPAHVALPPWPAFIPTNQYFGLITGPAASHGGHYPNEVPYVKAIQNKLNLTGFGPIAVDGNFGPATAAAVTKFQHAHMPGTKFYGQVWTDDYRELSAL